MTYTEFIDLVPSSKASEDSFDTLLIPAQIVIRGLMAYDVDNLAEKGLLAYNTALALQIDYAYTNGLTEGNLQSQSIEGTAMTFANSGKDKAKVFDISRQLILNAGLGSR